MANIPSFEVPPQMRDLAETSVEQARKAFGTFIGSARRATDTLQGSTDLTRTNASDIYARSPAALQLRAMNIIYETTKERGATILIPTTMIDAMNPGTAMGIVAAAQPAPA